MVRRASSFDPDQSISDGSIRRRQDGNSRRTRAPACAVARADATIRADRSENRMQNEPEHRTGAGAKPHSAKPVAPLALTVNGKPYEHEGDPAMPLLWFLRDTLRLTGTKFGCGVGACGAC